MPSDQDFDHSDVEGEVYVDECVADDSTECTCSMCSAKEERFWREQGEQAGELEDEDRDEPDDSEDRP